MAKAQQTKAFSPYTILNQHLCHLLQLFSTNRWTADTNVSLPIVYLRHDRRTLRSCKLHWWERGWYLLSHSSWSSSLACPGLRQDICHSNSSDLQPPWLLWGTYKKRRSTRLRRAASPSHNHRQPEVFWRILTWHLPWTWYWWALHNYKRWGSLIILNVNCAITRQTCIWQICHSSDG